MRLDRRAALLQSATRSPARAHAALTTLRRSSAEARHRVSYSLGRALRIGAARSLSYKQYRELAFWRKELATYIAWYRGEIPSFYEHPAPSEGEKVTSYDLPTNAVLTLLRASLDRYPRDLRIPPDQFRGKRLLEIGSGPVPYCLAFTGCEIHGLDPLLEQYRIAGFPLDRYSERLTYVNAPAEAIPAADDAFDAVIAVNALDHVDDFAAAAREIARVLRRGGTLRIETHYHEPTVCEPQALDDDVVLEHFGHLDVRKVYERPAGVGGEERIVVWSSP